MITLPFQRKKKEKLRPTHVKKGKAPEKFFKGTKGELKEKREKKTKKELGKSAIAFSILKEPIISEKATRLEEENKYVFKIFPRANQNNIKRAIEEIYKVEVEKVNIIKVPSKRRRIGRTEGKKSGYKKAVVTLKKGEKIEVVSR